MNCTLMPKKNKIKKSKASKKALISTTTVEEPILQKLEEDSDSDDDEDLDELDEDDSDDRPLTQIV